MVRARPMVGAVYGRSGSVLTIETGSVSSLGITAFLLAKKYSFLEGFVPEKIWNHKVVIIGLSFMLFKFIHVLVDAWQGVQSLHSLKNLKDLQVLVVARSTTWVLAFRNEGPILGSG